MKVVELADELGLTMFEILDLCDRIGIDAVNGASELPERDASRLRRLFGASEPPVEAEAMQAEANPTFPAVTIARPAPSTADAPTVAQVPKRRRSDQPDVAQPPGPRARREVEKPGGREPAAAPRSATESPLVDAPDPTPTGTAAPAEAESPVVEPGRAAPRTERRPLVSRDAVDEGSAPKARKRARDEPPARAPRDGRGLGVLRWLIPVVVAAVVVAIGAVLFGGGGTTNAPDGDPLGALAVEAGTCFNATEGATITEVGVVDCASPHVAEVFLVTQHPARADEAYPGSDELAQAGLTRCTEPFEAYVGEPLGSSNLVIAVTHPTESSWVERGDRTIVCSVVDGGGATLGSSVAAEG